MRYILSDREELRSSDWT